MGLTITIPRKKLTYSQQVLKDNPLGYWRLGETSGTTATDSSGNGYDGEYINSPTLGVDGLIRESNKAVTFNGSSQFVEVAQNTVFNSTAISAEAWVSTTTTGATQMIMARDAHNDSHRQFQFRINISNYFEVILFTGASTPTFTYTGETIPNTGARHLVFTYSDADSNTIRMYLDGSKVLESTISGPINQPTGVYMTIATRYQNDTGTPIEYFSGTIDEPAFYDYELPGSRVLAHYNAGK